MQSANRDSIWRTSLPRLRQDWQQVFTTHLTYTVLGVILFTPLAVVIGRLLLSLSDQPVLADQDIAWLLLSPAGIVALVFFAGISITILAVEQASLMVMGVDGVITDEPALTREVITERADLNLAERLLMHTAIMFGKPEPQRLYRDESP